MIAKSALLALARTLEGIPVLGTLGGTPAARAGIVYGDVLLEVNGRRTRNVIDYIEAKALRTDGMDVVIFRAGSERRESLVYDSPSAVDPTALVAELMSLRIAGDTFGAGGGSLPSA